LLSKQGLSNFPPFGIRFQALQMAQKSSDAREGIKQVPVLCGADFSDTVMQPLPSVAAELSAQASTCI